MPTLQVIFLVLAVFGALPFFGITGPKLFKYAKGATSSRSRGQIAFLVFAVAMTGALIFMAVRDFKTLGLTGSLGTILMIPLMWFYTLIEVWKLKLSKMGQLVTDGVRIIMYLAFLALVSSSIVSNNVDKPLWQELGPFLGAPVAVFGLYALWAYLVKKRNRKRISQEVSKDPPA